MTAPFDGDAYQRRFDQLARAGQDVHGEAAFVAALGPRSVLDAGCGTGRVAIELARRGIVVEGADVDASMLDVARRQDPALAWHLCDVADLHLDRRFDVVVMAGNVLLFTAPGSEPDVVAGCARHLAPGGALVAGFQLRRSVDLDDYDRWCAAAGLRLAARYATWDLAPFVDGGDYAVSVHHCVDLVSSS